MPLNPPVPGLRRIRNFSGQVTKVQVNVPPGDELKVSDTVASQLLAASTSFRDQDAPAHQPKVTVAPEAAPEAADEPLVEPAPPAEPLTAATAEPTAEAEPVVPAKKAAKKAK